MPWYVDAKDIDIEISKFRDSLLHPSGEIDEFLSSYNKDVFVVGPKGTGKSLLLRLKRHLLERNHPGIRLLPENAEVDKFVQTTEIFSEEKYRRDYNTPEFWYRVWMIALSTYILKEQSNHEIQASPNISKLLNGGYKKLCSDIFSGILSLNHDDYYKCDEDLRNYLIPQFRLIDRSVALFIDNVDEYFLKVPFETDPLKNLWHFAQIGLMNAIWDLSSLNDHVKIYASIRVEAYNLMRETDAKAAQMSGVSTKIRYEHDDLLTILTKNIEQERKSNLVNPGAKDPISRFFGNQSSTLIHEFTGEEESICDFVIRHTLWRPRDIAMMGRAIRSAPPHRRSTEWLKSKINEIGEEIVGSYISECAPYISHIDERQFFSLLPSNVLSFDQKETIREQYNTATNPAIEDFDVFQELFRIGLVGYLHPKSATKDSVQAFPQLGRSLKDPSSLIPKAETYLIHPALYGRIDAANKDFLENLDKINIVGRGRPWRTETDIFFVIMCDIVGYSKIMDHSDLADEFPRFFSKLAADLRKQKRIFYCEVAEGDKLIVIDRNAHKAVTTALAAQNELEVSVFRAEARIGGDAGILRYNMKENSIPNEFRGRSLRRAARLERVAEPGEVIATDNFQRYAEKDSSKMNFEELSQEDLPKAKWTGEKFNIAKNDNDEATLHRVYRIIL